MPKVGYYSFRHKALPNGFKEFEISFGNMSGSRARTKIENKRFFILFPEEVSTFYGKIGVEALTVEEAKKLFSEKMTAYYDQGKKTRKVIGYNYGFKTIRRETDPWDYNTNKNHYDKKLVFVLDKDEEKKFPEQQLQFEFVVGYITEMGGKEFFSFSGEEGVEGSGLYAKDKLKQISGPGAFGAEASFTYIDYSPEREAWFKNTYNGFASLINKMREFFDQDEQKFLAAIENPAKLLKL